MFWNKRHLLCILTLHGTWKLHLSHTNNPLHLRSVYFSTLSGGGGHQLQTGFNYDVTPLVITDEVLITLCREIL
jgi:hypothetical protein